MKNIKVGLGARSYNILIANNALSLLGSTVKKMKLGPDAYIITNPTINKIFGNNIKKNMVKSGLNYRIKIIADTEKSKSLSVAYSVIRDLANFDRKKRVFIIALGGGVVGDLAGFVASIYKRGIAYIQIPTTLLAQVDSAIGGKTAVDLITGKNLVGAFYQPKLVLSDTSLLKTLSLRQLRSGLSEVIKYGIIKDPQLFNYLEINYKKILQASNAHLEFIISRSSKIKAKIVSEDEKEEKGKRTLLNFGHTIGHAIEAAGGYKKYNHGEAIALGMLVASDISISLGLATKDTLARIERLITKAGLPVKINKIPLSKIIKSHYLDKKFSGKINKFVLIERIGKVKIAENIPLEIIKAGLKKRA